MKTATILLCLALAGCCTTQPAPPPEVRIVDNTCTGAPSPAGAVASTDTEATKRWVLGYAAWYNATCKAK